MKAFWRLITLVAIAAALVAIGVQPAAAAVAPKPLLYGTTGACNNDFPGGPCTQNSSLVQIDPQTGAPIKVVGPVGYTVTGLAWDNLGQKMYASTAIGCGPDSVCPFHGLITIDLNTGAGTPVNSAVHNFGLDGAESPIHSISINGAGRMVAWYDEFGGPTDTFVTIDKATGIATEHADTGIDTSANGLSFDVNNLLWNIDTRRCAVFDPATGACKAFGQTAYLINPKTGKPLSAVALTPPTMAALGDFNPFTNLYYGLKFNSFSTDPTFIEVVNLSTGTVTQLGRTIDGLHTLAFVKKLKL